MGACLDVSSHRAHLNSSAPDGESVHARAERNARWPKRDVDSSEQRQTSALWEEFPNGLPGQPDAFPDGATETDAARPGVPKDGC